MTDRAGTTGHGATGQGATILGCAGPVLDAAEAAFFRDADPFGFILFARNIETPAQVARLTADLRDAVGREAPVLIDQEGGRVQRMTPPQWRAWLPPLDQVTAAGPDHAARSLYLRYRLIAADLRAGGIDTNCAPVADVARAETHPFLRNRCYGEDAGRVVTLGRAVADGLRDGGVLPVLKHLPGHGRAIADSHLALPRVTAGSADLDATDFAAFRGLNDLPLGMTAHIVYEALDPAAPATASPRMIGLIRDAIGFDGLLMTDDISMGALSGGIGDRSAAALSAGCDVILHCNGDPAEMAEAVAAAGRLAGAAADRADRALAARGEPDAADPAALEAELDALLAQAADV